MNDLWTVGNTWVHIEHVALDALVLMNGSINIHSADNTLIVLDQFHIKILHL